MTVGNSRSGCTRLHARLEIFHFEVSPSSLGMRYPSATHSHPPNTTLRSLGQAPNGLPFGNRRWEVPVFDFITATEATKDLPPVGLGRLSPISNPDHRPSESLTLPRRNLYKCIPKWPRAMGLHDGDRKSVV